MDDIPEEKPATDSTGDQHPNQPVRQDSEKLKTVRPEGETRNGQG